MEYAVIGLGKFGSSVALELTENGHEVLAIDIDPQRSKEIMDKVNYAITLDATDEKALMEISINHLDAIIVGMGKSSMSQSLLTCLALQTIGVKRIIAKAVNEKHALILKKIGITEIINPEEDMGKRLAKKLTKKDFFECIELSDDIRIDGFAISNKEKNLVNKTIGKINLRQKIGINIICIKRADSIIVAETETVIKINDVVIVVGETEKINLFKKEYIK